MIVSSNITIGHSAYCQHFPKSMKKYFNAIFPKYIGGFRKGYSTQLALLFMLESLIKALDKGLYTGIMLTDLSKAFDCIPHDLLIAKLNAYGFTNKATEIINDYLCERKQRTKNR